MNYGICILNCVAIRSEASEKSEMTSQLLFGETCKITDSKKGWLYIVNDFDEFEGWIHHLELEKLSLDQYQELKGSEVVSKDLVNFISENQNLQVISIGASLPNYQEGMVEFIGKQFQFDGLVNTKAQSKQDIVNTAYLLLNTPFLWGGRTSLGLDCSGFTQLVYKINGHKLLRNAAHQASQGEVLSFIEESEPGDLAFFDDAEGNIIHVGIILANNYIMHCYGKVRLDRLDQSGIYNVDTKRHTHKLRVMKQIF